MKKKACFALASPEERGTLDSIKQKKKLLIQHLNKQVEQNLPKTGAKQMEIILLGHFSTFFLDEFLNLELV